MSKPAKVVVLKKRKPKREMVTVDRNTVYFPSEGDPHGQVHVTAKWHEALMMANLLVAAFARSGISLNALDLPGTAAELKANADAMAAAGHMELRYPGDSLVHAAIASIRVTRDQLDRARNTLNPTNPDNGQLEKKASAQGQDSHEAEPESLDAT